MFYKIVSLYDNIYNQFRGNDCCINKPEFCFFTTTLITYSLFNLINSSNDFLSRLFFVVSIFCSYCQTNTCQFIQTHINSSSEDQFNRVIFIFDRLRICFALFYDGAKLFELCIIIWFLQFWFYLMYNVVISTC